MPVLAGLSAEAIATYRTQGYCLLSGVVADRLDVLRADVDKLLPAAQPWRGAWLPASEKVTLVSRHKVHERPAWQSVVEDPVLLEAVAAVMGATPTLDQSTLVTKPPETGQPFPPHQDAAYYSPDDRHYVIASIYLDDATEDNGPILFLPGSHLRGALPHDRTSAKAYLPAIDVAQMVPVMAKAGDAVLFSHYTVHASRPNRSAAVRRTVRLGYRSR